MRNGHMEQVETHHMAIGFKSIAVGFIQRRQVLGKLKVLPEIFTKLRHVFTYAGFLTWFTFAFSSKLVMQ